MNILTWWLKHTDYKYCIPNGISQVSLLCSFSQSVMLEVGQYNIMSIPEHIWRFPTRKAIDSLAKRFNFPNTPEMQDWEWEVARADKIDEFISAYESGQLDDDEKFTLMETIIQSFDILDSSLATEPRWKKVLKLIEENIQLHIFSVWYWSDLRNDNEDEQWRVNPFIKSILMKYKDRFAQ